MSRDLYDPVAEDDLRPGRFDRPPEKSGAVSFENFLRLSASEQAAFVDRVRGGFCDKPRNFERFAAIVDERRDKEQPLPGGTTHAEKIAYEHRLKARLVDLPGERFERRGVERFEPDPFSPFKRSSQYQPSYPWQRS